MVSYHLYKFPLAERKKSFDSSIQAAFIGFGVSAAAMLDGALEHAQLPCFCRPEVETPPICANIFCTRDEARLYLEARPALKDFFSVQFSFDGRATLPARNLRDSWGMLIFRFEKFNCYSQYDLDAILSRDLDFAFVSLNNKRNSVVARTIEKLRTGASVHMADETLPLDVDSVNAMCRRRWRSRRSDVVVYSERDNKLPEPFLGASRSLDSIWMRINYKRDPDRTAIDLALPENRFYRNASISSVCVIPEMLRSINRRWIVDFEGGDNSKIADGYRRMLARDPNLEEIMVMALHRRSDVYKLCRGWQPWKNVQKAVENGSMKNMTTKEHVGITHSSLGSPLSDIEFRKHIMEDKASEEEWNKLDPQDRMNVLFNIRFAKQADVSPWSLPVIKENDLFVARNIPYILTGDDELFVPQTL